MFQKLYAKFNYVVMFLTHNCFSINYKEIFLLMCHLPKLYFSPNILWFFFKARVSSSMFFFTALLVCYIFKSKFILFFTFYILCNQIFDLSFLFLLTRFHFYSYYFFKLSFSFNFLIINKKISLICINSKNTK